MSNNHETNLEMIARPASLGYILENCIDVDVGASQWNWTSINQKRIPNTFTGFKPDLVGTKTAMLLQRFVDEQKHDK